MLALVAPCHATASQVPLFAVFKAQDKVLTAQVLPQALKPSLVVHTPLDLLQHHRRGSLIGLPTQ